MAGVASPVVGGAIARRGGRPVLAMSAVQLATGLLALALAHSLPLFLLAWLVMGFGMAAGLYDPAFATLGRLYGHSGRSAITTLTLFGGFASTVCWPLSAFLEANIGWRGACFVYAAVQLVFALPIYLFVLPRETQRPTNMPVTAVAPMPATALPTPRRGLFLLLATTTTLASIISTVLSVHLLTILQGKGKGLTLAAAVSLGVLVGPSQVTARTIEMFMARYHHPIWTKLAATSLVAAGLADLWGGRPLITISLLLYGAGIGLESIARGTLPLAIYGEERYPVIIGRIAMPSLIFRRPPHRSARRYCRSKGRKRLWRYFSPPTAGNALLAAGLFILLRSKCRHRWRSPRSTKVGISTSEDRS